MSTTAPATGRFYRPELDVLRFIAFLAVFFHHSVPLEELGLPATISMPTRYLLVSIGRAGAFGMCLFFVLSAYLICELLLREKARSGTIARKAFYIRRMLRIWPLYFLGLFLGLGYSLVIAHDRSSLPQFAAYALLSGNWYCTLVGLPFSPMTPLWSISVEEQFYLFSPWAIKVFDRRGLYLLWGILIVLANIVLFHYGRIHGFDPQTWCNSFVQFEMFATGMLLCLVLRGRTPSLSGATRILLLLAGPVCWWAICYFLHFKHSGPLTDVSTAGLMGAYALGAVSCAWMLIALLGTPEKYLPKWAIYLGRISFGLYVYTEFAFIIVDAIFGHHSSPAIILARKGLALALTILFASLSYRFFEKPFLRLKERFEVIRTRPA